jgi:ABC-2 type transport system permease protein
MKGAWRRILAVFVKESRQLLRDRATLGMLIGIPILQIILFGCAIELSPHSLDVAIVSSDRQGAERLRRLIESQGSAVQVTSQTSLASARIALARGETLMVVDADASPRKIYIDATDPVLAAHAEMMIDRLVKSVSGSIGEEQDDPPPVEIERLWNPAGRTQPYLVSGLLGVILTMSLVMMSALSIARERERGTLEGLLAMPVRRAEIWVGKLAPYLVLAVVQAAFVLLVAYVGFDIRPLGSIALIFSATLLFATANLALGFLFSCIARQQMQAMQMTFFFFLPSSLLSGFMFPFSAMPAWARTLAEFLPLTHYLRIVRGLVLRGVDTGFVLAELMPIAVFAVCVAAASMLAWRR